MESKLEIKEVLINEKTSIKHYLLVRFHKDARKEHSKNVVYDTHPDLEVIHEQKRHYEKELTYPEGAVFKIYSVMLPN